MRLRMKNYSELFRQSTASSHWHQFVFSIFRQLDISKLETRHELSRYFKCAAYLKIKNNLYKRNNNANSRPYTK